MDKLDTISDVITSDSETEDTPTVLSDLLPGARARIVRVHGRGETTRRIVDMGVTRGALIVVEKVAPLGDPMEVKIKGYHLSLRRSEASKITVDPV